MEIKHIKDLNRKTKFVFLVIFTFVYSAKADSPITSTDIHKAYSDIEMVSYARKKGKMDEKIANYLHDTAVKIDIKAAVINAVGWSIDGKKSAKKYSLIIFDKPLTDLDVNTLNADDLFCLGYLQVLDDYFHPKNALPYIEKAKELNDKSFTVSVIYALIQAQNMMNDQGDWCKMWEVVYKVYNDKSIYGDMREDAKKIIWDYMINYKCK
jgi:hypothetical protein